MTVRNLLIKRFPEASETIVLDFAEFTQRISIEPSSYIVIVTRGHQFDETVLEQLISTDAKYIE